MCSDSAVDCSALLLTALRSVPYFPFAVGEEPAQPEAEEGSELAPAEAVAHAEAEVQHYEQVITAGKATVTNAAAALDMEKQALAAVVKVC